METNEKIAPDLRLHEKDVGSASVQIARLTARILHIGNHLKTHSKDNHSRRGLIAYGQFKTKVVGLPQAQNTGNPRSNAVLFRVAQINPSADIFNNIIPARYQHGNILQRKNNESF